MTYGEIFLAKYVTIMVHLCVMPKKNDMFLYLVVIILTFKMTILSFVRPFKPHKYLYFILEHKFQEKLFFLNFVSRQIDSYFFYKKKHRDKAQGPPDHDRKSSNTPLPRNHSFVILYALLTYLASKYLPHASTTWSHIVSHVSQKSNRTLV